MGRDKIKYIDAIVDSDLSPEEFETEPANLYLEKKEVGKQNH